MKFIQSTYHGMFDVYCGREFLLTIPWSDLAKYGMMIAWTGSSTVEVVPAWPKER